MTIGKERTMFVAGCRSVSYPSACLYILALPGKKGNELYSVPCRPSSILVDFGYKEGKLDVTNAIVDGFMSVRFRQPSHLDEATMVLVVNENEWMILRCTPYVLRLSLVPSFWVGAKQTAWLGSTTGAEKCSKPCEMSEHRRIQFIRWTGHSTNSDDNNGNKVNKDCLVWQTKTAAAVEYPVHYSFPSQAVAISSRDCNS